MPIPETTSFEPDAIAAMSCAFEESCSKLEVSSADARGREIIAMRIIDLARSGVADAGVLRDRVLLEAQSTA